MNKKIGRNGPCPCGSGKKYKSCCWNKDRPKAATDLKKRSLSVMKGGIAEKISQLGTLQKKIEEKKEEIERKEEEIEPPESTDSLEP